MYDSNSSRRRLPEGLDLSQTKKVKHKHQHDSSKKFLDSVQNRANLVICTPQALILSHVQRITKNVQNHQPTRTLK